MVLSLTLLHRGAKFLKSIFFCSPLSWSSMSNSLIDWLIVWGFTSQSKMIHSDGDVTITGEGLQSLSYTLHSWLLICEGSLECHTYCDTGQPFIMVISEDPSTHTYCRAFGSGAVTTYIYDIGLSQLGFEHPNLRMRDERSIRQATAVVQIVWSWSKGFIMFEKGYCFQSWKSQKG